MIREQNLQVADAPNMAYDAVLTAGNLKPILFSTPMVQAILRGEKTQTRRLCKFGKAYDIFHDGKHEVEAEQTIENILPCKYKIGDILWVRETWRKANGMPTGYRYEWRATALEDGNPIDEPWKPSIFMPKQACRIFLKLKSIRIEKLNNISESDAIAEGIERWTEERMKSKPTHYKVYFQNCKPEDLMSYTSNPIDSYETLWQKINGEKSWSENPFVWVYEFERTDASLPKCFQERIDKFRTNNDRFRIDYESYEVFCCEQAVVIANACKTPEEIQVFASKKWDEQLKQVPELSDGHSGNTFGASCHLAHWYLSNPENVIKMHGALSPLVGSDEYGDVAR